MNIITSLNAPNSVLASTNQPNPVYLAYSDNCNYFVIFNPKPDDPMRLDLGIEGNVSLANFARWTTYLIFMNACRDACEPHGIYFNYPYERRLSDFFEAVRKDHLQHLIAHYESFHSKK